MTSGARRVAGPVGEDRLPHSARLVLGHLGEAGAGDQLHGGKDPAHEVGAAGAHVLVGGVEDRLERGPERLLARHVALPELLERVAGVVGAGPLRVVVGLLVAAAGDVVLEEPPDARFLVVAREDRHDHETLHRGRQVHADHLAEPVGLPLEREVLTLDLLVVLELGLEEPGHLRRGPGRTGDADAAELVGLEDLLDTPARDLEAGGRLPVADRKSTRLNSSHSQISYAVFCLKKKKKKNNFYVNRIYCEIAVS